VNKLDRNGRSVRFRGPLGCAEDMVARGCARAARRELDTEASTEWLPVWSGKSHQPLKPGEIVPLEIALEPSCTFFEAGESIELIVSADEIVRIPPFRKDVSLNRGVHVFHAGGAYDSHLLIPVINPPA
jgi:predicted acyl esterase